MSQWATLDEMLAMTEVSCTPLHSFLSSKFRLSAQLKHLKLARCISILSLLSSP